MSSFNSNCVYWTKFSCNVEAQVLIFFFTGYPVLRTTENQCFAAWPFGGQSTLQGQKLL